MSRRKKTWLIIAASSVAVVIGILFVIGYYLSRRFEPFIREQAIAYLQDRFKSEVELASLSIGMPELSTLRLAWTRGRGALAHVTGEGVVLRHHGRRDLPPMLTMKEFSFDVDLASVLAPTKVVQLVEIRGMEINIPPKGQRPQLTGDSPEPDKSDSGGGGGGRGIFIQQIMIDDCVLMTLPRDPKKKPLRFDIHRLKLESVSNIDAMQYDAALTNAKPPGEILSQGTFGPWNADEPGDSPLAGHYVFDKADLGVFRGIAGILHSTGDFVGTLSEIDVHGEATVPNFRLRSANNPVPLKTTFEVLVDGTNGDTILKPVVGTLGKTTFTTSGTVIKDNPTDRRKTISLDVNMPNGDLRDILKLAVKGEPFMEGRLMLKTKIDIPPLSGPVREKLRLDGSFEITDGKFLKSTVQDQIDTMSRRAQGQPNNKEIDEVVSAMGGTFVLDDQVMTFSSVSFSVPGSGVDLKGTYDLGNDVLDFHGTLRLDAKISQTMSGWKRWLLKPIDPFFSKDGSGTLLKIQVVGSKDQPKFGRDRGNDKDDDKK